MTPEQQSRAALAILKPPRLLRSEVREEVAAAISEINNVQYANAKPQSGGVRKKLRSLLASLQKSQTLANELAELDTRWGLFRLDLHEAIARCERDLRKPAGSKSRSADRQKLAVAYAHYLITEFGDENDLTVTRKNKWHALATVLYGEKRDPFRH